MGDYVVMVVGQGDRFIKTYNAFERTCRRIVENEEQDPDTMVIKVMEVEKNTLIRTILHEKRGPSKEWVLIRRDIKKWRKIASC